MNENNLEENLNDKRLDIMMMKEDIDCNSVRIGDKAPCFHATTTMGPMKLSDYMGKWVILFSHPGDFTPVCTTEFIAFAKMNAEFEKRNCCLLGLSVDNNSSHLAWVTNIHKCSGVQIPFPVIADSDMKISRKYGMIAPNVSTTQTVRNVYIICPEQRIRAILQYPLTNGRSIAEILRLLEAIQLTDREKMYTPANWFPGQPTIIPAPKTYAEVMERMKNPNGYTCMDWYLCFNQEGGTIPMNQQTPFVMPHMNCMQSNMNQNTCMQNNMMNSMCQNIPTNE